VRCFSKRLRSTTAKYKPIYIHLRSFYSLPVPRFPTHFQVALIEGVCSSVEYISSVEYVGVCAVVHEGK